MLRIEDFLPSYPDYEPNEAFTSYAQDMDAVIQAKQEFAELKLEADEAPGDGLLKHQKFVQRFLSGYTPYDSLLLWHDVGTGKTISALAVAEGMKNFNQSFRKALVLVRSDLFYDNIRNELVKLAPMYAPDPRLDKPERTRLLNRLVRQYYELDTFQVFAKHIQAQFDAGKAAEVRDVYSNRVIVIDEAHNVRQHEEGGGKKTYDTLHTFLHTVQNCKILLLSATPVRDTVDEFATLMNLILPDTKQLPTGDAFQQTFFQDDLLVNQNVLADRIKGRVSYLRQTQSTVKVVEAGESTSVAPFPLVRLPLTGKQAEGYREARQKDGDIDVPRLVIEDDEPEASAPEVARSGLYKNTRSASLFVTSQKKYDKTASNRVRETLTGGAHLEPKEKLERLKQYSAKYHYLIDLLTNNPKQLVFVYSKVVEGSGLEALAKVLEQFSFFRAQPGDRRELPRYALITGQTPAADIEQLLADFNHERNKEGKYIRVLLGSTKLGEGRSLMSVRHVVIMTPYWNFTDMDQAIGRGIRFGSHRLLAPEEQTVTLHRLCVFLPDQQRTIDELMYKRAYDKDKLTKQVEAVARSIAVDCTLNKARNQYPSSLDSSRQCLYQKCEYTCAPVQRLAPITDTYNLFYTEREYNLIRDAVQEQFSTGRFSFHLNEWLQQPSLNRFTPMVLLGCLRRLVYSNVEFRNPLGFKSYLKHAGDTFFLSHDLLTQSDQSLEYETQMAQSFPTDVHSVSRYEIAHAAEILTRLVQLVPSDEGSAARLWNALSDATQTRLTRRALERKYINQDEKPIVRFVLQAASDKRYRVVDGEPQLMVSTNPPVYATLRNGQWIDNARPDPEQELRLAEKTLQRLQAARRAYYVIGGPKKFKISKLDDIPKKGSHGMECGNWKIEQLMTIAQHLAEPNQSFTAKNKSDWCAVIYGLAEQRGLQVSQDDQERMKNQLARE